jgi:hypothetical protein
MIRILPLLMLLLCWTMSQSAETLTVSFQTTAPGGQYKPANILAVWIETPSGTFVKTIGDWSNRRRSNLVLWRSKAGTSDTDAIMGATRGNHTGTLTVTWNMLPRGSTTTVADGDYKVWFENVDNNGGSSNHRTSFTFSKNGTAASNTIASQDGYLNINWSYSGRTSSPPAITSATTATATRGTAFTYTITASNSPTSYNATGLPAGLSVNTMNGVISGTPTATGTSSVALSATNGAGTGTATLTLTVNPPKPVISSAASASGTVNTAFSYTITASNTPTSYNATGLPAGLSVNTTSGVISGTPTASGSTAVTISATNAGGTGTATLTVAIASVGGQPTITSPLSATATAGSAFSYTIMATGSPTSYGASGLPSGLSVNTSTGVISGTPTTVATSTVTISATNGSGSGSASLVLTVQAAMPVITSATTVNATLGEPFTYTIVATNSPTSYGATGLPAGLTLNSSTGVISGTPTVAGSAPVTVSATNSAGTSNKSVNIAVQDPSVALPAPEQSTKCGFGSVYALVSLLMLGFLLRLSLRRP